MDSTRGVRHKFSEDEHVLCYEPDPTKAKVLYDSKVLKVIESKDERGRCTVQYLIHFQGWNSSWDRCVSEDFVLKDTEENRQLQRDLAKKSKLRLGACLYRRERKKGSGSSNTAVGSGAGKRARHGFSDDGSAPSTQPDGPATSKFNMPKNHPSERHEKKIHCSHCDKFFPTNVTLIRHLYSEIGITAQLATGSNPEPPTQPQHHDNPRNSKDQNKEKKHAQINNISLKQPIILEDRDNSHNLPNNDEMKVQKPIDLQKPISVKKQNKVSTITTRRAAVALKSPEKVRSLSQETTKTQEENEYGIRYKCRLCGEDFKTKTAAHKHKTDKHSHKGRGKPRKRCKVIFQYTIPKKPALQNKYDDDVAVPPQDDVTFFPHDNILPKIVSVSGYSQPKPKVQLALNMSNDAVDRANGYLDEHQEDSIKTKQDDDIECISISSSPIQECFDTNESYKNNYSLASSVFTQNIDERKRKGEARDSNIDKKRTKALSNEVSSTDNDDASNNSIKHNSRKEKTKRNKHKDSDISNEENSQLGSSDTDAADIIKEIAFFLKKRKRNSLKRLLQLSRNRKDKMKSNSTKNLYKCKICSIHFMHEKKLRKHLHKQKHNDKKKHCVVCNLKFSKKSVKRHVKKHHVKMNLGFKDFDIITELSSSESSDTESSTTSSDDTDGDTRHLLQTQDSERSTLNENHTEQVENDVDASKFIKRQRQEQNELEQKCMQTTVKKQLEKNIQKTPADTNHVDERLYKCSKCDVHYFKEQSLVSHMARGRHDIKERRPCPICHYTFSSTSLERHISLQHLKLQIEKFTIVKKGNESTQESNNLVNNLKYMQLKECVEVLTDSQSALVSSTLNDASKFKARPKVDSENGMEFSDKHGTLDVDIDRDTLISEKRYNNISASDIGHDTQISNIDLRPENINAANMDIEVEIKELDDTEMESNNVFFRNSAIVSNSVSSVKILSNILVQNSLKIEEQQPNGQNISALTNTQENLIDDGETDNIDSTIVETSYTDYTMPKKFNNILTKGNDESDIIENATQIEQESCITSKTQNSVQDTARDIITKVFATIKHAKPELNSDDSCSSDSTTLHWQYSSEE